ncbi:MAG TPA: cholesterol oxidase substrate-binding domain-containing protein [Streptosporangiaceae bacterium]|nr:cholesterol oxidase substrate-binding domain-containing protein [Streptosporangiaceae bacterium]
MNARDAGTAAGSGGRPPETPRSSGRSPHLSRRALLAAAGAGAAGAALGWFPGIRVPAGRASTIPAPPNFPSGISLYQQTYQNWSQQATIDDVWTCAPASDAEVVTLANWAYQNSYTLRASGFSHNWSPLVLPNGANVDNVVLVNTTDSLTGITVSTSGSPATVTAQGGVSMDNLTAAVLNAGYSFCSIPAPGDITIGGVLAIDGHGTAIPATGETRETGMSYGSVSNLVQSLTAVTWNGSAYALQTFQRSDPAIAPFLVNLGRTFITEVTLEIGKAQNLLCTSTTSIGASTLFAAPASAGSNSFASLVNKCGRVESIWFPFTTTPWVKTWTVSPSQPWYATEVSGPYNYTFANDISQQESDYIEDIVSGVVSITPTFEDLQIGIVDAGLLTTWTYNLWGPAKYTQLYVQPTTERVTSGGWALLTSRASIQQVVYDFYTQYQSLITSYAGNGQYPMNGPLEIRVTGLDQPSESGVSGATTPLLSALTPRPDQPAWNVCVWIDMLTIPTTPECNEFYEQMEQWIFSHYTGSYAAARPEWSKGWAYTSAGPWTNTTMLTSTIPAAINAGQAGSNFSAASAAFDSYDPYRIFSNTFLDTLLP